MMGEQHLFTDLKAHAEKEFTFKQRRLLSGSGVVRSASYN